MIPNLASHFIFAVLLISAVIYGACRLKSTNRDTDPTLTSSSSSSLSFHDSGWTSLACSDEIRKKPSVVCGTLDSGATPVQASTVEGRIQHCLSVNQDMSFWDGTKCSSDASLWKLVTLIKEGNTYFEVWRDETSKILWSSPLETNNLCAISGNNEPTSLNGMMCNNHNPPVNGKNQLSFSYCRERNDRVTPDEYDSHKGGMRLTASESTQDSPSPSVTWTYPQDEVYQEAEVHGLHQVFPNFESSSEHPARYRCSGLSN